MPARARLLMCPPDHFDVSYIINPWMQGHLGEADAARARRQWQTLRDTLATLAEIECQAPVAGLPDLVFTANAGLLLGNLFVPSRFLHAERRGEEAHDEAWFQAHGYTLRALPAGVAFEGAGDALFDRAEPRLWFGHGHRSGDAAAAPLQALLGVEVVPLRLVDPRFYHLDTCFCPLAGGDLLYYPAAFDDAGRAAIAAHVPAHRRIAVGEEDALAFACNAMNVDAHVVLNRASPALRERLRAAGYSTIEVDVSEFLKAGGAVKCLSLRLDETLPAPASARIEAPAATA
ncbi:MAG TPA: arginine deiminase-related protein [Dokdonella sp.]